MISNYTLILIPVISSLIGWLTNYVAVKMLFHPRNEIKFLFIRFHGVFPRRQQALAKKLGVLVATELFSSEDMKEKLKEGIRTPRMQEILKKEILGFITETLPAKVPLFAMLIKPEFVESIQGVIFDSISPSIEKIIDSTGGELMGSMDIEASVEEKVANFSSEKLEHMLFAIMKKEFRFIEILGGVLGFFIGCAQLLVLKFL